MTKQEFIDWAIGMGWGSEHRSHCRHATRHQTDRYGLMTWVYDRIPTDTLQTGFLWIPPEPLAPIVPGNVFQSKASKETYRILRKQGSDDSYWIHHIETSFDCLFPAPGHVLRKEFIKIKE